MSNRYRLIKEYPGSPKLGTIVYLETEDNYMTNMENDFKLFPKKIVENYPEFWELVVEYPIGTKVHNSQTNTIYTKKEDGWYKPSEKTGYTDEIITKSNYINIIKDKVVEKDYEILSYITIESELIKYKEKAEEYILLNKPCLSYGDVQEYLKVKDCNKVLDLAQSKIKQSV